MMDGLQIIGMELPRPPARKKRKRFKERWGRLARRWVEMLRRSKSVGTYRLAHTILREALRCEQWGGEIVLSAKVTGMAHSTRMRAVRELVKLKLIKIQQNGKQAVRVVKVIK